MRAFIGQSIIEQVQSLLNPISPCIELGLDFISFCGISYAFLDLVPKLKSEWVADSTQIRRASTKEITDTLRLQLFGDLDLKSFSKLRRYRHICSGQKRMNHGLMLLDSKPQSGQTSLFASPCIHWFVL